MTGNDQIDDFALRSQEIAETERKKKELEADRVNVQHERMLENKAQYQAIKQSTYGIASPERAAQIAQQSTNYLHAAKKQLGFINNEFLGKIPFFQENMILIGAKTGEGKTTCASNIVYSLSFQKHPVSGKIPKCLVITNEESISNFYNRLTCLYKGWHYVDHDLFTEEQIKTFENFTKVWADRITVVDDQHSSNSSSLTGATTTPEGIEHIFENIIRDGDNYDVIILDYYQGIIESKKDPTLDEYKCQRRLTQILEKYRKIYPAPIIVMAQVDPMDKDNKVPFQRRIQGTKLIGTRATMHLEMVKHSDHLMTEWVIHKGRFAITGQSIKTGYQDGKFVEYSDAFKLAVQARNEKRADKELNKQIGVKVTETVNG